MSESSMGGAELETTHLDAFFTGAPVGMFMLDDQLRFVRVNEVLAKMNGLLAEDHLGKSISELFPNIDSATITNLKKILATGEPRSGVEGSGEIPNQPGVMLHWLASSFRVRCASSEESCAKRSCSGRGNTVLFPRAPTRCR